MTLDDKSPPNSWQQEMDRMPWKYKEPGRLNVNDVLARMRQNGLWLEANTIAEEISRLRAELFSARERLSIHDKG
jgi:hypothetical protein